MPFRSISLPLSCNIKILLYLGPALIVPRIPPMTQKSGSELGGRCPCNALSWDRETIAGGFRRTTTFATLHSLLPPQQHSRTQRPSQHHSSASEHHQNTRISSHARRPSCRCRPSRTTTTSVARAAPDPTQLAPTATPDEAPADQMALSTQLPRAREQTSPRRPSTAKSLLWSATVDVERRVS